MKARALQFAALLAVSGCIISGCSWGEANSPVGASDSATGESTPAEKTQLPESMKTGTVTGETEDQPVFHGSL